MVCADDGKRRRGWELYLDLERRRPEEEVQEEETGSGSQTEREGGAEALDGKRLWRWTLYAAFLFQGESSRGGVALPHPANDRFMTRCANKKRHLRQRHAS